MSLGHDGFRVPARALFEGLDTGKEPGTAVSGDGTFVEHLRAEGMAMAEHSHVALLYDSDAAYSAALQTFCREAAGADEPVLVAVPRARLDLVRDAATATACELLEIDAAAANPVRFVPYFQRQITAAGPTVRVLLESTVAGSSAARFASNEIHECLLTRAFDGANISFLCPFDASTLSADVLTWARATHPSLLSGHGFETSADYELPEQSLRRLTSIPLDPPPAARREWRFDAGDLGMLRDATRRWAEESGLGEGRLDDFVTAVNELCANAIVHGGGEGHLCLWHEQDELVAEVRDRGYIQDQLAGLRPPTATQLGQRGLWIVNLLSDLVERRTGPTGTQTRIRMSRQGARPDRLLDASHH